ncbi:MAG: histidyl-tRNA synthetase [Pseudoalteromonas tetraodonis]|jgi:histidyl-tRNA synthetase
MAKIIDKLKGFRDFYPDDCAVRNYVFGHWRSIASRYGFVEYEGPILESTELYKKKSGDEIAGQLFCFEDKGGRDVSMRPELTPTLARMAAKRQRDYKKPMKWFGIGRFFRYEKNQKGRLREFYQFNCDLLGDASSAADAELIALAIDLMRSLGFTSDDFMVRLSDRRIWDDFVAQESISAEDSPTFLTIIDKMEREKPEVTAERLEGIGTTRESVDAFIATTRENPTRLATVINDLSARGLGDYLTIDPGIVRGLAYYTGTVFEIFDKRKSMRAIAGGGRYDGLVKLISDGKVDLPSSGFAMGDVVITDFINETKGAKQQLMEHLASSGSCDAYVILASEDRRPDALGIIQKLRTAGIDTDFPLGATKVDKQFKAAEATKARAAIVIGDQFPQVTVKDLATRESTDCSDSQAIEAIQQILAKPPQGPLLA